LAKVQVRAARLQELQALLADLIPQSCSSCLGWVRVTNFEHSAELLRQLFPQIHDLRKKGSKCNYRYDVCFHENHVYPLTSFFGPLAIE
jgi:hypothetical protein